MLKFKIIKEKLIKMSPVKSCINILAGYIWEPKVYYFEIFETTVVVKEEYQILAYDLPISISIRVLLWGNRSIFLYAYTYNWLEL